MTTSDIRPEAAGGQDPSPVAEGDLVITWYDYEPVKYGGPGDGGPFTTLSFGLLDGSTPVRTCDPDRVAPADTPIPPQDSRVSVVKRPRSEMPHGEPGNWQLILPGQHPTWYRTKRDGTTAGLRRVAILDWHAARTAPPVVQDAGSSEHDGDLTRDH